MDKNLRKDDTKNRKIVMLTITESCNLNCLYCYEHSKSKKEMSLETAQKILISEFENSKDFDEVEIDLFGGEPTLRFDFIKSIVEWTIEKKFSKPFVFFIDTNGTKIHNEFQKWLIENKKYVWVGLSLDGTPETHNHNRSNSYNNIDIDFFIKEYPEQPVRMTVYEKTINNLSKDIKHLHKLGFDNVSATFAGGIVWDFDKNKEIIANEFVELIDFYIANPHLNVCSIFDMQITNILNSNNSKLKWCGSGTSMSSYDNEANKYPCHIFQPNTTGKRDDSLIIDFDNISDFSDPECENCIIQPICPNCYGMNYLNRGDILDRDKELCGIVKLRALATSILKTKQIEKNIVNLEPTELYHTISAIEKIQNEINI